LTSGLSENPRIRVPVILGPTASGKTELAIALALELGLEILSCDSRQIYRHMDIGTAKPTPEEQRLVKHWMIDVINPEQRFSCFQFARDSQEIITDRFNSGTSMLICGGSGLYFKGLSEGIGPTAAANEDFRKIYFEKAQKPGGDQEIYNELKKIDPLTAKVSCPTNIQRNIRALEVYVTTGVTQSEQKKKAHPPGNLEFLILVATLPRTELYRRIDNRVDTMIKNGLFDEFKTLRNKGYDEEAPGLHCLGYKELFSVENGSMPLSFAANIIKTKTRNYAKRQITWFKHQSKGIEFPNNKDGFSMIKKNIENFLHS
jgi:tRNA dimethylallyltransferase